MTDIPTIWKPIAFSASMALAIRERQKTETRRLMNPKPDPGYCAPVQAEDSPRWHWRTSVGVCGPWVRPRWLPGEGLWIREPICAASWIESPMPLGIRYAADREQGQGAWHWKPIVLAGRYMPKAMCRTLAVVEKSWPEQAQDITEQGATAEGCASREHWIRLWDSLHNKPGERFEDDPWVWAYRFRLLETDHAKTQKILTRSAT